MFRMRIEIRGRNRYWRDAVQVEWEHQFPDRKLLAEADRFCLIEASWLPDLERVAEQCFSTVTVAPEDPGRLSWLRRLMPREDRE